MNAVSPPPPMNAASPINAVSPMNFVSPFFDIDLSLRNRCLKTKMYATNNLLAFKKSLSYKVDDFIGYSVG